MYVRVTVLSRFVCVFVATLQASYLAKIRCHRVPCRLLKMNFAENVLSETYGIELLITLIGDLALLTKNIPVVLDRTANDIVYELLAAS